MKCKNPFLAYAFQRFPSSLLPGVSQNCFLFKLATHGLLLSNASIAYLIFDYLMVTRYLLGFGFTKSLLSTLNTVSDIYTREDVLAFLPLSENGSLFIQISRLLGTKSLPACVRVVTLISALHSKLAWLRLPFSITYLYKYNVPVLYPPLAARLQDDPSLLKMFGMMIVIVMLYCLPGHIDHIAILQIVHGFCYLASSNSSAAIHMSDDMCPQWPCMLPCNICSRVDGCTNRVAK